MSCCRPRILGTSARRAQRFTLCFLLTCLAAPGTSLKSQEAVEPAQVRPGDTGPEPDSLPENLWTRKAGSDWPTFLGPRRDGKSSETGIRTDWSAGLPILWQRELGSSYGIGVTSRGRYFQFDRLGGQAQLVCLCAETGEQLWEFNYRTDYADMYGYDGGPRCSPVVDGNRAYVYGVEGMLHCLRVSDGQLIWKCNTFERFGVIQNFFGVGSTPIVEGDLLIVVVGGSPAEDRAIPRGQLDRVSSNGTGVVAFDKRTGQVRYKIADQLAGYASPITATIDGRRWCFAFCRGGLVAFEPASGRVDFQFPWRSRKLESVNASTPVVVGNHVFISETYGPGSALLAVRPGGYDVVWQDDARRRGKSFQAHWATPVHHEGYLYGCSGRNSPDAEMRCVEWSTGEVQWRADDGVHSSFLYVDGHFVCLEEYGRLLLVKADAQRRQIVAQWDLGRWRPGSRGNGSRSQRLLEHPCWAAPILSHGLLYVRGRDRLLCLELIPAAP